MRQDLAIGDPEATTMSAIKGILEQSERDSMARRLQSATETTIGKSENKEVEQGLQPVLHVNTTGAPKVSSVPQVDEEAVADAAQELELLSQEAETKEDTLERVKIESLDDTKLKKMRTSRLKVSGLLTPTHIGVIVAGLFIVLQPALILFVLCLALFCIIGAFLLLGADRIWSFVSDGLTRLETNDPARGEVWRTRLDAFAYRWDTILDRFPEGTVDHLYMPDFSGAQAVDAIAHEAILNERLARMHNQV